mmetsp:Transcript_27624/g.88559  ORF Transcript_27624/g.88559 Transcript_27624/m.88559 type:complete len:143 (+) Transcript_27624:438-866(+)
MCAPAARRKRFHVAQPAALLAPSSSQLTPRHPADTAAVASLFDAAESRADLISIEIVDEAHIKLRWRLEGVLRIPVKAPIKPYTGTTIYTVGPSGKIVSHFETWDISALDAVVSTFVPSFGAPPAPPVCKQGAEPPPACVSA